MRLGREGGGLVLQLEARVERAQLGEDVQVDAAVADVADAQQVGPAAGDQRADRVDPLALESVVAGDAQVHLLDGEGVERGQGVGHDGEVVHRGDRRGGAGRPHHAGDGLGVADDRGRGGLVELPLGGRTTAEALPLEARLVLALRGLAGGLGDLTHFKPPESERKLRDTIFIIQYNIKKSKYFLPRAVCAYAASYATIITSGNRKGDCMTSIDQQFVEFIVKSLVSKPEAVTIERRIDEKGVLLELTVDPEDLGRVIGKRGATAQSVRTLLRALGTKNDARYNLKIVDVDRPGGVVADDTTTASDNDDEDTTQSPAPVSKPVEETTDKPVEEKETMASRTRKELADMDDLDI